MKIGEEELSEGVDYCGPVKTSHKGFFLATLEKLMKEWPGGSHLVMNMTQRVPGDRPLMDTRYNYISKNVLGLIDMEGSGSTIPDVPYSSCYPDRFSNVSIRPVFPLTL